ncbi:MAG: hypothetical protein JKY48_07415 [Flavobacteriales bacterium]|nr:hypothetical protein [Flavobacteriales bacterium]
MNLEEEYRQYLMTRKNLSFPGKFAPYDWIKKSSWQSPYMAYSYMLWEHAPEISNSINDLRRYIFSLDAWSERLSHHDDNTDKFKLIVEFINPIATLSINLPYVIRSQFIYSTAHLSHQANQSKDKNWKDEFPLDSKVCFSTADKYGTSWKSYGKLKTTLETIANKEYISDTYNFRNLYNHRFPPRIELGQSGFVTRNVADKRQVSYGLGETKPLKLEQIVPLLKNQHAQLLRAFELYQKLIEEQIGKIEDADK